MTAELYHFINYVLRQVLSHVYESNNNSQLIRTSASRQLQFPQRDGLQHALCGNEEQEVAEVEKRILEINCERQIPGGELEVPGGELEVLGGEHGQQPSPLSTPKAKRVHWVLFPAISAI